MKTINIDENMHGSLAEAASIFGISPDEAASQAISAWVALTKRYMARPKSVLGELPIAKSERASLSSEVGDYLLMRLSSGPVFTGEIFEECDAKFGVSTGFVRRRAEDNGIVWEKLPEFRGKWIFRLRQQKLPDQASNSAPTANLNQPGSTRASSKSEKSVDDINAMLDEAREIRI